MTSLLKRAYYQYVGAAMSVLSRYPIGTNVYERDWDALVILDTCRVDALREVAPEYDFIGDIDTIWSVGSASAEWIAQTFTERYRSDIEQTALVSANAFTERVLWNREFPEDGRGISWTDWQTVSHEDFEYIDQPWRYADPPPVGLTLPRPVTDRAISVGRERNPRRLVVHYEQPHHPFTARAIAEGRETLEPWEIEPFEYLKSGGDYEKVWDAYLDNLRWVLDEVEILLKNLDAEKVALSADHGNAYGEWGMYMHRYAVPVPEVRRVPWAETTATDEETFESTLKPPNQKEARDVDEHLRQLGYLD
ncbi:LTA synthase family protein [Halomicroarcula sp. F13]|uniref:LTA synthase family protein n=1 Tax=Haloarcula rubra TaxID=2487747 RepID=A0AAW4PWQ8_9EURY|nr:MULTISPECIES: LTA synthase family protein [Halomicroarcula]MBX0324995.1 LTA synthase family protein [Halomicroarcula rubra]MDS0280154.1 LTA synthase family protein [Halomicroarcula sp. S1AR25-4]